MYVCIYIANGPPAVVVTKSDCCELNLCNPCSFYHNQSAYEARIFVDCHRACHLACLTLQRYFFPIKQSSNLCSFWERIHTPLTKPTYCTRSELFSFKSRVNCKSRSPCTTCVVCYPPLLPADMEIWHAARCYRKDSFFPFFEGPECGVCH